LVFSPQNQGTDDTSDSDVGPAGQSSLVFLSTGAAVSIDVGLVGAAPAFGFALGLGDAADAPDDFGEAVVTDGDGNVCVAGSFRGTVDFDKGPGVWSMTSGGFEDAFLAKYTPTGALAWARRFGGGSGTGVLGIALDGFGNIYLTGAFSVTVDFDP